MIDTYDVEAVAAKFGKSPATVLKRCARKEWPHHREGRFVYFTDEDVAQIVEQSRVEAERQTGQTDLSRSRAS